jgi:hypothetical protein
VLGCLGALCGACELGGSNDDCTNEAFSDAVQVTFAPELTEPGEYELGFTSNVVDGICRVVVGGKVIEPCTSAQLSVTGKNSEGVVVLTALRVWFDYAPQSFELSVTKDGVNLLERTFTPEYAEDEPNGNGCGVRRLAVVPIAITL